MALSIAFYNLKSTILAFLLCSFVALGHCRGNGVRSHQENSNLQQAIAESSSTQESLLFQVESGGNVNYFLRDNLTTAQLLLTSSKVPAGVQRLVVALPAGNSGALVYFLPSDENDNLTVQLKNGTLQSTTDDFNNVGIQAEFNFSANATLGVTIIGAVRAMRDYVEGSGTMHAIFNYTLLSHNAMSVRLHRQCINSTTDGSGAFKGADMYLNALGGARFEVTPSDPAPIINVILNNNGSGTEEESGTVQVRVLTNETTLPGFGTRELFLDPSKASTDGIRRALEGLADGADMNAQQFSFLTLQPKFTAGGWRFLTYFGRDTLIALRLLMPLMTPDAIESALGAVIERVNATGALCHEETIGDYASFVNIGNNRSDLGNSPFYDYKMIDTDLFLLPTLSHYLLDLPQGRNRGETFLVKHAMLQNGTYAELLIRTIQYNLARAIPFFLNSSPANLLSFRPGQPVGNWRDSNQGTGYGPIPFDVNTALVPASLRATARLARAGVVLNEEVEVGIEIKNGLMGVLKSERQMDGMVESLRRVLVGLDGQKLKLDYVADMVANVWEEKAERLFEVSVDADMTEARLLDFVQKANLSEALINPNNTCNENTSDGENKTFYALSLREDGSPVEVLHSDIGFALLYGMNVSKTHLQRVVEALDPYPRGLLTNIGMLVANPAYDSNRTNVDVLNRAAYHGTVVWSWQQGLMAAGLARQLNFCTNAKANISAGVVDINPLPEVFGGKQPEWCEDEGFVNTVIEARERLWVSIKGGVNEIFSEVWSYTFDNMALSFSVADLASISPDGTESDAIQLWSYGFLGLLDPSGNTVRPTSTSSANSNSGSTILKTHALAPAWN